MGPLGTAGAGERLSAKMHPGLSPATGRFPTHRAAVSPSEIGLSLTGGTRAARGVPRLLRDTQLRREQMGLHDRAFELEVVRGLDEAERVLVHAGGRGELERLVVDLPALVDEGLGQVVEDSLVGIALGRGSIF